MKKSMLGVCVVVLGLLLTQNALGQPLHAEDQSAIESTVPSTVPTSDETVPSATENIEEPVTAPSTVPSEEIENTMENTVESTNTTASSSEMTQPDTSDSETISDSQSTESSSVSSESTADTAMDASESSSSKPSTSKPVGTESTTQSTTSTSNSSKEKQSTSTSKEEPTDSKPQPVTNTNETKNSTKPVPSTDSTKIASSVNQPVITNNRLLESQVSEILSSVNGESLDQSFRVSEVAESDLKGFELPLLNSFEDKTKGILVYEEIKSIGQYKLDVERKEESQTALQTTEDLINTLVDNLFGKPLKKIQKQLVQIDEKQAGDLLYKNDQLLGLYLGADYYLKVAEPTAKQIEEKPELAKHKVSTIERFQEDDTFAKTVKVQRLKDCKLTEYGQKVEASYPASMDFSQNTQTQTFIQSIAQSARKLGLEYDVFASVMIAQAILESGSGTSLLSTAPNYNLFGVKGSYQGASVSFATQEDRGNGELYTIQAAFRKYPSYTESLGDYISLIRGGIQGNKTYYQSVWRSQAKNYLRAADSLTGTYATDTTYNRKISSLIAAYHLTQYDVPESKERLGSTSAVLQGKEDIPEQYQKAMTFPDYDGKNYNSSGSYPIGQCTWYAYNRVAQLGKHVDDFMGNGGEWGDTAKRLGYRTSQEPQAGWLISFSPGTAGSSPVYGHVAFVEAVTSDGILISEGNVLGGTIISYRVITNSLARSELVTYVEPK
ncbi:glucosaminidase domain-containing protein [Enterococcus gallinarum]|uniref:glucosaminidase domain-containing protein n=1 Tax=Enterococcus gallinarum TaxID=1353 RepID=UPI0039BEDEAF